MDGGSSSLSGVVVKSLDGGKEREGHPEHSCCLPPPSVSQQDAKIARPAAKSELNNNSL